jgi:predicted Zn finger-like uncharacterized protein
MTPMVVQCSSCLTEFELDPAKVPAAGVRARCSVCSAVIVVPAPPVQVAEQAAPLSAQTPETPPPPAPEWSTPVAAAPEIAPPQVAATREPEVPEAQPAQQAQEVPVAQETAPAAPQETPTAGGAWARRTPPYGYRPSAPEPAAQPAPQGAAQSEVRPEAHREMQPAAQPAGAPDAGHRRPINPFLTRDPALRAKRLARALVSDIVAYHPARHAEGLRDGSLKTLFRDEIKKSYEEYVDQVGRDFAGTTTHFQDALNDVLASGRKLF